MDWSLGNIIWIIIGGSIIGIIARLILPGRQNIPWWSVIVAGIVGMFVGDAIAKAMGDNIYQTGGFDWIRHGLQLVVGVVAVWLTAVIFEKVRSGKAAA